MYLVGRRLKKSLIRYYYFLSKNGFVKTKNSELKSILLIDAVVHWLVHWVQDRVFLVRAPARVVELCPLWARHFTLTVLVSS